jgi:hypothetical protein
LFAEDNRMTTDATGLELPVDVKAALRARLPSVAALTVDAVTREVQEYAAIEQEVGETIRRAVQLALATFLRLAAGGGPGEQANPMEPAVEGAYALGRGEARSGRTMDALLSAYRVGARTSWREWSAAAVDNGLPAGAVARFAELVFAYIDELSAASAAGHTDELARSGRVRQQYLERLGAALLSGEDAEELQRLAERADWSPPTTLTAVVLPAARVRGALPLLDPRALALSGDVAPEPGLTGAAPELSVLLVPDADRSRAGLLRALAERSAVVGPARPWTRARASYLRAARALAAVPWGGVAPLDTEQHLVELVVSADPDALADLRAQALAPLRELRPATAERLAETLAAWLALQGRREEVAAALHVHPQTVRYRMSQVRELYGERLSDPAVVRALVVALAVPAG